MPGHNRRGAPGAGRAVRAHLHQPRTGVRRQAAGHCAGVGAAAAVCAGVIKYVVHQPAASSESLLWGALILGGFGAASLTAALLVPITRFTPLVRMIAEWLEIVAIIAALPLAAWIGGLFTWVRMR